MEHLEKLKSTLINLLGSKKFVTSLIGVSVVILAEYDIIIPQEATEGIIVMFTTFVGGQALVDLGKEIKK